MNAERTAVFVDAIARALNAAWEHAEGDSHPSTDFVLTCLTSDLGDILEGFTHPAPFDYGRFEDTARGRVPA